jgi:hypothetical protein
MGLSHHLSSKADDYTVTMAIPVVAPMIPTPIVPPVISAPIIPTPIAAMIIPVTVAPPVFIIANLNHGRRLAGLDLSERDGSSRRRDGKHRSNGYRCGYKYRCKLFHFVVSLAITKYASAGKTHKTQFGSTSRYRGTQFSPGAACSGAVGTKEKTRVAGGLTDLIGGATDFHASSNGSIWLKPYPHTNDKDRHGCDHAGNSQSCREFLQLHPPSFSLVPLDTHKALPLVATCNETFVKLEVEWPEAQT